MVERSNYSGTGRSRISEEIDYKGPGLNDEFSPQNSAAQRADAAIRRAQMDEEEEENKLDGDQNMQAVTDRQEDEDDDDDDDDLSSNSGDDENNTKVFYTQKDLIVSNYLLMGIPSPTFFT